MDNSTEQVINQALIFSKGQCYKTKKPVNIVLFLCVATDQPESGLPLLLETSEESALIFKVEMTISLSWNVC